MCEPCILFVCTVTDVPLLVLQVGDLLHFTIRDLDTIFGDMQLDVHTLRPAERADRTLHELERAQVSATWLYSIV